MSPSSSTAHRLPLSPAAVAGSTSPSSSSPSFSAVVQQELQSAIPECILQRAAPEWVQAGRLPYVSADSAQSQQSSMPQSRRCTCYCSAGSFAAVLSPCQEQVCPAAALLADPASMSSWWSLILASRRALEGIEGHGHLEEKEEHFPATLSAAPLIISGTHRRRPAPSSSIPFHFPYQLATPPPQDYPALLADSRSTQPPPCRRNRSLSHTAMHINQSRPPSSLYAFTPFGTRPCIHVDCIEEGQECFSDAYLGGPNQQPRIPAKCGRLVPRLFAAEMPPKTRVN